MRLIDIDAENKLPPTASLKDNFLKDDAENFLKSYDSHGIGYLSDGPTMGKFDMTAKIFNFLNNTKMQELRYIFMRNIGQTRRLIPSKSDFN